MTERTESLSERFSALVRAHLAFKRLGVTDLAAGIGISESTLYRRLNEGAKWPLDEAQSAAEWFGFGSLSDMLRSGIQEPVA